MKKRNKKYNKIKAATSAAKAGLKNLILTFNAEDQTVKVRNLHTGKEEVVTRSMFNAVWQIRYKWELYLCARIREKNGKESTPYREVQAPFDVYHNEINDSLSTQHKDFLDEEKAKGNEIINVGWIASHIPLAMDKDQVMFVQDAMGL